MKLATAVSTPDAKFSALALKGPFEETFAFAAAHGLDGVEIHVRDPRDVDADQLLILKEKHGLEIPAIGTGRAFGEDGLSFSDPDAGVRAAAVRRIKSHVDLAARLGAGVIIGLIVGKSAKTPESEAHAAACMKECAAYGLERNVEFFVEPINRYETGFLITARDCLDFFEKAGAPNCGVLLDTFHANIEEADILETIKTVGPRIGHVHVADSNRRYPGAGHIDFAAIVSALRDTGYDRWLSAEMFPDPDPHTSITAMAAHLRRITGALQG